MTDFVTNISQIVDFLKPILKVLEPIKSLSAIAILGSVVKYCWYQYHYVKVTLSCGSFKVRKKDFTWQKLTPIVSRVFYGGGNLPDHIRKEILNITEVPAKDIVRDLSKEWTPDSPARGRRSL